MRRLQWFASYRKNYGWSIDSAHAEGGFLPIAWLISTLRQAHAIRVRLKVLDGVLTAINRPKAEIARDH